MKGSLIHSPSPFLLKEGWGECSEYVIDGTFWTGQMQFRLNVLLTLFHCIFQRIKWRHTYNIEYARSMGGARLNGSRNLEVGPRVSGVGCQDGEKHNNVRSDLLCIVLCVRAWSAVLCQPPCREKPWLCSMTVLTSCTSQPTCLHPACMADFA